MSDDNKTAFPYPIRGLGIIAIFLCVGPPVQTIVQRFMAHQWIGGSNLLVEITDLFVASWSSVLAGYSYNMPAPFIAGCFCALVTAKGLGIGLQNAILRSIVASIFADLLINGFVMFLGGIMTSDLLFLQLTGAVIQAIFFGWISWIIATGFRLDKPVEEMKR